MIRRAAAFVLLGLIFTSGAAAAFDRRVNHMTARAEGIYFTVQGRASNYFGDLRSDMTLWHFEKAFYFPKLARAFAADVGVGVGGKTAYTDWEVRYSLSTPQADVNGKRQSIQLHTLEVDGRSFLRLDKGVHPYIQLGLVLPYLAVSKGASYQGSRLNASYAGLGANVGAGLLLDLDAHSFINVGASYRYLFFLYAYGEGKGRDTNHLRLGYEGPKLDRVLRSSSLGVFFSLGFML